MILPSGYEGSPREKPVATSRVLLRPVVNVAAAPPRERQVACWWATLRIRMDVDASAQALYKRDAS